MIETAPCHRLFFIYFYGDVRGTTENLFNGPTPP
jgi:hypothetical protein